MVDIFDLNELITHDNEELIEGESVSQNSREKIVVYSRDWTVETVVNQILQKNIDLDPSFQRRNAWNDSKRSQLIESYLIGYPVPEIVLAEHPHKKGEFIVIDGKQRLLTLCGFIYSNKYNTWDKNTLRGLRDLKELNGKNIEDFKKIQDLNQYIKILANSDVRCTIIANIPDSTILYDIFYRLNAGATPLSMQELRQVLYAGDFTKFMLSYTNDLNNLHRVLKLEKPDNRLKDVEILIRTLAIILDGKSYTGNLKAFLDKFTDKSNKNWINISSNIKDILLEIDQGIDKLANLLDGFDKIGRKLLDFEKGFEGRFNTVLFEVMVYFSIKSKRSYSDAEHYKKEFYKLCLDPDFNKSISTSTKNIKEYTIRFRKYAELHYKVFNEQINHPWK